MVFWILVGFLAGSIVTFIFLQLSLKDAYLQYQQADDRWERASHLYSIAKDAFLKAEEKDKKYRADAQLAFSKIKEFLKPHLPGEVIAKFDEINFTS